MNLIAISQMTQCPAPYPREPQASGALYGDLPLVVPRLNLQSPHVVIFKRENGTTWYSMTSPGDPNLSGTFKISTCNEFILAGGVRLAVAA